MKSLKGLFSVDRHRCACRKNRRIWRKQMILYCRWGPFLNPGYRILFWLAVKICKFPRAFQFIKLQKQKHSCLQSFLFPTATLSSFQAVVSNIKKKTFQYAYFSNWTENYCAWMRPFFSPLPALLAFLIFVPMRKSQPSLQRPKNAAKEQNDKAAANILVCVCVCARASLNKALFHCSWWWPNFLF